VRVPAFWGLVVAFAGYGLAFSAMSFHLIPLLDDRHVPIGVVMAIIALIGPIAGGGPRAADGGASVTSRRYSWGR